MHQRGADVKRCGSRRQRVGHIARFASVRKVPVIIKIDIESHLRSIGDSGPRISRGDGDAGRSVIGAAWRIDNAVVLGATALMAVGVWLHLTEHHEHDHTHEAATHSHLHAHRDGHHDHAHDFDWDENSPHDHVHQHLTVRHKHPHFPDVDHRHAH